LFALQTAENLATHQAGFAADKEHLDDEVIWDDGEEDDDASSKAAVEGSSATHGDDGSEELKDSGEPLSHSSKFPGPSSLRDWSEDDDDEPGSAIALGGAALHVATAVAAGAQATPIVDLPESPEQPPVAPELAASKPADLEGARNRVAGAKRGNQPALTELAEKQKKAEPAVKSLLLPRMRKVVKRRATTVDG
jgi:hypothetical protein